MAIINKNGTYMPLPSGIKRGNPIPLDTTAVWYTYAEMKAYAEEGLTAYVGQILTLVDSENNNEVTAYVIMDEAGSLQEVGSATLGDNKTIILNEESGLLGLKNWGVQYYKWVESEVEGEEGQHVLVTVDETNPWLAGLEPKVVNTGSGFELAWYQPSSTTIEGVSSIVSSVQTSVTNLTNAIGTAEDAAGTDTVYGAINAIEEKNAELEEKFADYLPLAGGTMTGDLVLADGHKAASEDVVDTKIATAIGSAGHLKREIVEALPALDQADPDTIYMVKNNSILIGDAYDEYMLIDGKFEQIGNTTVDLSNYVTKVENATEGNIASLNADGALVDSGILASDVSDHIADEVIHITSEERTKWDNAAALAAENEAAIAALVTVTEEQVAKLDALPAITEIGEGLTFEDGVLDVVVPDAYELPIASADELGGIRIGTGLAIDEEGVVSVDLPLASADAAGLMSAEHFVKLTNVIENAQVNVVEGALLGNDTVASINENKQLVLPFATATAGLVTTSEADNHISVNATTGAMSVNRIGTSKLFVDEEGLILNGGNAQLA